MLKPLINRYVLHKKFETLIEPSSTTGSPTVAVDNARRVQIEGATTTGYESELDKAKLLAKDDPKLVANIISSWLNKNG